MENYAPDGVTIDFQIIVLYSTFLSYLRIYRISLRVYSVADYHDETLHIRNKTVIILLFRFLFL